ncbi:MAG: glycosyltransferase family 1 protein [Lactobacillaceae bacterium]|jgi:glycosyltransferase involved in cell wall biosynthesis|nr:glycosyltransferase family 1 protein [Lactobacillaceae bacterium]
MTKPIRILHVLQRMEAGGTQALLMNLYRTIDREKVQFDFFVEYSEKQFYDDEIQSLGGHVFYSNVRKDFNLAKYIRTFRDILRQNPEYRTVHVHTYSIGYFILKAAQKEGTPNRIAHSHSNQAVHSLILPVKLLLQKLYTIHATELFAASKEAGEYLFKNKKFKVLKNAINTRDFIANEKIRQSIRKELGIEKKMVIGHVGRFQPEKNHVFLLKVFKEILSVQADSVLLLTGTGPLEAEIKSEVMNMGIENSVIFLGNRRDMPRIYQAMDVFVFPSLYEGFGISAIEAQASGIPILCSEGIPPEVNITPLFAQLSLTDGPDVWAKYTLAQVFNPSAHKNMQEYILKAGFDIFDVARSLQDYYLSIQNK